jgi:hypothetical protein
VQEGVRLESIGATPAEEAFLTAIAVAQGQKAKSFELQAIRWCGGPGGFEITAQYFENGSEIVSVGQGWDMSRFERAGDGCRVLLLARRFR